MDSNIDYKLSALQNIMQEFKERFDDFEASFKEAEHKMITLVPRVEEHDRALKRLFGLIEGNGKPGLAIDVAKLAMAVKLCLWIFGTLGSAILVALVSLIFQNGFNHI